TGVFPDHCAVGGRELQPGLVNRITFEVSCDDSRTGGLIAQVGVARLRGVPDEDVDLTATRGAPQLEEHLGPVQSVLFTGAGDVCSSVGGIEVLARGSQSPGLEQRLNDWLSGGPSWLLGSAAETVQLLLEVDMSRGCFALRLGTWFEDPLVVSVPGILDDTYGRPLLPFVSLTAIGQQARLLDLHVVSDS
ncbi:unnamed protein product, partial [Polarella glacialis]